MLCVPYLGFRRNPPEGPTIRSSTVLRQGVKWTGHRCKLLCYLWGAKALPVVLCWAQNYLIMA